MNVNGVCWKIYETYNVRFPLSIIIFPQSKIEYLTTYLKDASLTT